MRKEHDFTWQSIDIHVSCTPNWLNGSYAHIEVKAQEPLPITNTGYRSHFMPQADWEEIESVEVFLLDWIDEASQSKDWKQIWEARQQLSFPF